MTVVEWSMTVALTLSVVGLAVHARLTIRRAARTIDACPR